MAADQLKTTAQWQQLNAFATTHPGYFDYAQACIKAWGDSGMQLQHIMAIALKQMHEMGLRGEHPAPLGLGKAYAAQADAVGNFAIDIKKPPKPKMYVTQYVNTVKRVGRTPPKPTVKRVSRSC
jgi:hypothetical protein